MMFLAKRVKNQVPSAGAQLFFMFILQAVFFYKMLLSFSEFNLVCVHKTSQGLQKAALRVVGCQGVKGFLLKDVIITTYVTTVIFITITILVFELSQFNFF